MHADKWRFLCVAGAARRWFECPNLRTGDSSPWVAAAGGGDSTAASPRQPPSLISRAQLAAAVWTPGGQRPYLFGAEARPSCTNCRSTSVWGQFCQYKSAGPVCPEYVRQGMLASWVARGFELPLTMTPCDLWRHIEGRTLYMMGEGGSPAGRTPGPPGRRECGCCRPGPLTPSCAARSAHGLRARKAAWGQRRGAGFLCRSTRSRRVAAPRAAVLARAQYSRPALTPPPPHPQLPPPLAGDSMMLDYFKAMKCFMYEFWPSLENAPLTANQTLVHLLTCSTVVPRCARLVRNTSICYIRTDEARPGRGSLARQGGTAMCQAGGREARGRLCSGCSVQVHAWLLRSCARLAGPAPAGWQGRGARLRGAQQSTARTAYAAGRAAAAPPCARCSAVLPEPRHLRWLLQGQNFQGKALPALLENGMFAQGDILIANFGLHHGTDTVRLLGAQVASERDGSQRPR